jgi:hypothetical protein
MTDLKLSLDLYAIRHRPTGNWIPPRQGRGGSHDEPKPGQPRLFPSIRSARAFLSNWLQGVFERSGHQNWEGDWEDDVRIKKVDSRKKEEMEIVLFRAVEQ